LNFVLGFNARIDGRVPEAEEYFRLAYQDSPRNFHAARELASLCLIRGNHHDAEKFAREAFEIAQDNAYILDILLSVLIRSDRSRVKHAEPEIETLFERLNRRVRSMVARFMLHDVLNTSLGGSAWTMRASLLTKR